MSVKLFSVLVHYVKQQCNLVVTWWAAKSLSSMIINFGESGFIWEEYYGQESKQ